MTFFPELASGRSAAPIPEHNRLRGITRTSTRPAGSADPHPDKADTAHTHVYADLESDVVTVYYDTGADGGASTSYADMDTPASLSLPAGKWLIQAKGQFEFSTGTARTYEARLYDATGAAELDTVKANGTGVLDGTVPFALAVTVTLTAASTVRVENKVSAVDGSQLVVGVKIWATRVTAIS